MALKKLTILGSGTSTGIPMIGCDCGVCTSDNSKNKRLRTSFYLETGSGQKILIDASPDLRTQLLREGISKVDCAIITHDHADHVHGIDDLRPLTFAPPPRTMPIFTHGQTHKALIERFPYIFCDDYKTNREVIGGGIPRLELHQLSTEGEEVMIGLDKFHFFLLPHGHSKTLGIVHEGLAIFIDCHTIPAPIVDKLRKMNLELLIIDCVKHGTHQTHLTVETCFPLIERISPKRAGLIHMGHALEHDKLQELCKESFNYEVFPTYDTQQLFF